MNTVILIGRITKDIEVKSTVSGVNTVTFDLAVKRKYKEGGEYKSDFIRCVAFRSRADFLGNYAVKGDLIGVKGYIRNNVWEKDGVKRWSNEVICEEVKILSKRNTSGGKDDSSIGEGDLMPELPEEFSTDISDEDLPF